MEEPKLQSEDNNETISNQMGNTLESSEILHRLNSFSISSSSSHVTFGTPTNIDTLLAACNEVPVPPPKIATQIVSDIDNLSRENLNETAKNFIHVLEEQYFPWFAQHMIVRRLSISRKLHKIFIEFVEKTGSRLLEKEIMKATHENCKVLLGSDTIKSSSEERSLLVNLGRLMGKLTIERNIALKASYIDPKPLLQKACEEGSMIAVIPFISRMLRSCRKSIVYKPPNAWTMAVLRALLEIYEQPNLESNLSFEIQVLYRKLGVDMQQAKITKILREKYRESAASIEAQIDVVLINDSVLENGITEAILRTMDFIKQNNLENDENFLRALACKKVSEDVAGIAGSCKESVSNILSRIFKELLGDMVDNQDVSGRIISGIMNTNYYVCWRSLQKYATHWALQGINAVMEAYFDSERRQKGAGPSLRGSRSQNLNSAVSDTRLHVGAMGIIKYTNAILEEIYPCFSPILSESLGFATPAFPKEGSNPAQSTTGYRTTLPREPSYAVLVQAPHLLNIWHNLCQLPAPSEEACFRYILALQEACLLRGDYLTKNLFHFLTKISVDCFMVSMQVGQSSQGVQRLPSHAIDTYAKLILLLMKHFSADGGNAIAIIFQKFLSAIVWLICNAANRGGNLFNCRPYRELISKLLVGMTSLDFHPDEHLHNLICLADAFHALEPLRIYKFSYAWLLLVGHESFMPYLLGDPRGWPFYQCLLVDMFKFLGPILRNDNLQQSVLYLYKKASKLLHQLHDQFPDFLCGYHFSFCNVIPITSSRCDQMRNIVLSAVPGNVQHNILQSPCHLSDIYGALRAKKIKDDIDDYLKGHSQESFLTDLKNRLLISPQPAKSREIHYDVPLINSLVLYVATQDLEVIQISSPQAAHQLISSPATRLLFHLAFDLNCEGCNAFLNAVADQLRYYNYETIYFLTFLRALFLESNQEHIQKTITCLLVKRLLVAPCPWGIRAFLVDMIEKPMYKLWSQSFVQGDPELKNNLLQLAKCFGIGSDVPGGSES